MTRRVLRCLSALVLVVVLAACDVSSHIVVHPDGSGSYSMTMTIDNGSDNAGAKLFDAVKAAADKSPVPLPVERVDYGDQGGARIAFEFKSLDDLKAEADRVAQVGGSLGGIAIAKSADGWTFAASTDSGLGRQPGTPESGAPGGAIDPSQLGQLLHLSVVVELPGAPAGNNATSVTHTDTTSEFTWKLDVGREASGLQAATTFVGDQASVPLATATTPTRNPSSGSSSDSTPIVAALLMAAAVIAIVVLWRRRRPVGPQTAQG